MTDHAEAKGRPAPEIVQTKKPYVRPTLKKYGDVTSLTQGTNTNNGDNGSGSI